MKFSLKEAYDQISELNVHGKKANGSHIIATGSEVWILPSYEIPPETGREIARYLDIAPPEDVGELRDFVEESDISIVMGSIDNNSLWLSRVGVAQYDPKSSVLLKKIVNQLKIRKVEYSDDMDSEYSVSKKKMTGTTPDIAYHGTSSKYLDRILRFGLQPGESESNYPKIVSHDDQVFFSTRFDEAKHHAEYTASRVGGTPVVVELRIPDKSKLQTDYDVDRLYQNKGFQMSRELGIWGYKGRVPASHVTKVYAAFEFSKEDPFVQKNDYKKMNPKQALKYLDMGYFYQ